MNVEEMYRYLEQLIKEGKEDYVLTCEGGAILCSPGKIWDKLKEIEF